MNYQKNIAVYMNDGHGNYPQAGMEYPFNNYTAQLALDDIDTDGDLGYYRIWAGNSGCPGS